MEPAVWADSFHEWQADGAKMPVFREGGKRGSEWRLDLVVDGRDGGWEFHGNMRYIEPHGHMVSRTTDDYLDMVTAGCAAVCEPAFWAGFDRTSADGFRDYFRQLTEYEPARAARYGLPHYCWLCINPKESEDVALAESVIALIPEFLRKPTVLGIGEIGLNKNSRNELKVLEMHVDLAAREGQLILVHTPHLEDKLNPVDPGRVEVGFPDRPRSGPD